MNTEDVFLLCAKNSILRLQGQMLQYAVSMGMVIFHKHNTDGADNGHILPLSEKLQLLLFGYCTVTLQLTQDPCL